MATMAIKAKVPIALHMDHGRDIEQLKNGIELGYSSVMIDHSNLSYEENVRDTKLMVEFAALEGAWVQGEIGKIRGTEDWVSVDDSEALLTEPQEAEDYFKATGVNTLAASVGTVHGPIKLVGNVKPKVDIARIADIYSRVKVPIVLHGASGVPADVLAQAIEAGVQIINIDSELRLAFTTELRKFLQESPAEFDPRKYLSPAIAALKEMAMSKLKAFKTQNIIS
jgi:fructose-bisphosphate aldolase, class II